MNMSRIEKITKNIKSSAIFRNVLTISTGTLFAQILIFLFTPLITRIYGPEEYGVYGLFTSIATIIIPLIALTYEFAIVLPETEKDAKNIFKLAILIVFILSIFSGIIILIFGNLILDLFNMNELDNYINYLWLSLLSSGIQNVLMQWLIRKRFFNIRSKVAVTNALVTNIFSISVGLLFPSALTLILSSILGHFLFVFSVLYRLNLISEIRKYIKKPKVLKNKFNFYELKRVSNEYSDFPKFRAPQITISSLSNNLLTLFLTSLYGVASSGFYSIANRVLAMPTKLIGDAIGDAFYPHINEQAKMGRKIKGSYLKATLTLALIGVIPFGLIFIFGPYIFSLIFGSDWNTAGEFARWLSLSSYFLFITRPATKILNVIEEQKFFLKFTVIMTILEAIILLIVGNISQNAIIGVIVYSITNGGLYLYLAIICYFKCNKFDSQNREI